MAASSSPTVTLYISQQSLSLPTPGNRVFFTNYTTSFESKPRRFCIRNSTNDASVETTTTDTDSESSIEAPKGPPSLISALNVERALRGIPITDVDHYGRLGVARGSSYDQVTKAYQAKVEELINQGLDEEELRSKQDLLKESFTILSTPEERRLYDWSLARSEKPERYVWPFEVDKTKPPTEPPPPQEPEDVGPTRFVGYFLLGWLILSIALSIALAR
ncbi:NAD(P)H-quinone oxidoreductase subunit U, chloroplastic [Ziziphus jujuba]|uniref:NAD(P)H-quinone oxidoreductase subunit U, chloroplastic n=2 Tax=Ziziphus jujuba TaxID=326968 RepID=A0A6P3ZWK9_ZIZJJ|nr:NAD(P)H-quinone oxidoreductase subunit U, chloroplastic [Ziziphus jujuba]KAH7523871.1 hypothetical protein FEM48_Zijuj06G0058000 [Ziziphus jujuba var. spinosa]